MARHPTGSKHRAELTPREIEVLILTARVQTARRGKKFIADQV